VKTRQGMFHRVLLTLVVPGAMRRPDPVHSVVRWWRTGASLRNVATWASGAEGRNDLGLNAFFPCGAVPVRGLFRRVDIPEGAH
jgi:hypothetical protein